MCRGRVVCVGGVWCVWREGGVCRGVVGAGGVGERGVFVDGVLGGGW